jgi:hypothetical protein
MTKNKKCGPLFYLSKKLLKKSLVLAASMPIFAAGTLAANAVEPDVLLQLHPASGTTPKLQARHDYKEDQSPALKADPEATRKVFNIGVESWRNADSIDSIIQRLVDCKASNSTELKELDEQITKLRTPTSKVVATTRDSLNHSFSYQGVDPSARAGKLILDEPMKKFDLPVAEYQRQKIVDKIHSEVVAALLELSLGFGLPDKTSRTRTLSSGVRALTSLVGESDANAAVHALDGWLKKAVAANANDKSIKQISILDQEALLQTMVAEATSNDVIITQLTKRLNKYAHPGTIKSATSRVVETTLSGISVIGPGFAIPLAAAGALEVYVQGTGGSEQRKLEKELAMAQRIRSRVAVLTRETAMGLENYRLAQVTNNAPLQYFSQGLLCSMTSPKFVAAKLMTPEIVPDESVVPAIVETIEKDKLR